MRRRDWVVMILLLLVCLVFPPLGVILMAGYVYLVKRQEDRKLRKRMMNKALLYMRMNK